MGFLRRLLSGVSRPTAALADAGRSFPLEVVGESNYQDALWRAVRASDHRAIRRNGQVRAEVTAVLVPEPRNPHDSNAVCVRVNGKRVGYLRREIAPQYGRALGVLTATGKHGACRGVVFGGRRMRGRPAMLGIWLDLAEPDVVLADVVRGR